MNGKHEVSRVSIDPSLLGDDKDMLEDLIAAAINDAVRKVERTSQEKMGGLMAGMFAERELCPVCESPARDAALLCVVESPADVAAVEQSGSFRGRYYVLMGHLSPLDGIGPEELGLSQLEGLLREGGIKEVILATNPTVEGDATAHYIAEIAARSHVRASRIAHGVPVGGELEYVDGGTLAHALAGRHTLSGDVT